MTTETVAGSKARHGGKWRRPSSQPLTRSSFRARDVLQRGATLHDTVHPACAATSARQFAAIFARA